MTRSGHLVPETEPPSAFVALILVLIPLAMVGLEIHIAALPDLLSDFGSTREAVQWSLTAYLFGYALGQPFAGHFAEKHGRRPVVLWSLLLYAAVSMLLASSASVALLALLRLLQGLVAAPVAVVSKTVINDCFHGRDHQRMSNYASVAWAFGGLAPLAGAVTALLINWRAIFLVFGGVLLLLFFLCLRYWPETRPVDPIGRTGTHTAFRHILTNRIFLAAVSCMALISSFSLIFSMDAPFLIEERLHRSLLAFGLSAAVMAVAWSIGPLICQALYRRFSLAKIADSAFLSCVAVIILAELSDLLIPESLTLTVISLFLICIPGAVLFPIFLGAALRSNPREYSALASALVGSLFVLLMSGISAILSLFSDYRLVFLTALHLPLILSSYLIYLAFLRNSPALASA